MAGYWGVLERQPELPAGSRTRPAGPHPYRPGGWLRGSRPAGTREWSGDAVPVRIAIDDGGARMSAPERFRLLYALAVLPMATDFIETGSWPGSPRAWITEIVLAVVISALVHRVCTVLHELARQARVDELTGLWNRRAFSQMLMDEVARAHRTGCALTLIYLDLDGFKRINDELGHDAGDAALRRAATVILGAVRANVDRCFRIGGDEFALLLPASSAADASCVLQRIRARSAAMLPGGSLAVRRYAPLQLMSTRVTGNGNRPGQISCASR